MRRSIPRIAIAVVAVALVIGLVIILIAGITTDREPPRFDDDQHRQHAQTNYDAVRAVIDRDRTDAVGRLDQARARVAKTGEIGFPEIELDELLDDNDEDG